MCKTKAIDISGKDYIATQNHYAETNNPYYKCASNRKLYNKDVLEYNYNNKEWFLKENMKKEEVMNAVETAAKEYAECLLNLCRILV